MQVVIVLFLLLGSCIAQDTKCFNIILQDGSRQLPQVATINSAGNMTTPVTLFCAGNSVTIAREKGLLFYTCSNGYNKPQTLVVSTVEGQLIYQSNFTNPEGIYRNIFFDEDSSKLYGIESGLSSSSYFVEISPSDASVTRLGPLPYGCYSVIGQIISPSVMWTKAQRFVIQVFCEFYWGRSSVSYKPFFLDINMKNYTDMRIWLAPEADSNLFRSSQSESMLTINYAMDPFNTYSGKVVLSTSFLAGRVSPISYGNRTDVHVAIAYPQVSYPTESYFNADAFAMSGDNRTTWYNFGSKRMNIVPFLNITPRVVPYANGASHTFRSAFTVDCKN